jgi:hypothetical protein
MEPTDILAKKNSLDAQLEQLQEYNDKKKQLLHAQVFLLNFLTTTQEEQNAILRTTNFTEALSLFHLDAITLNIGSLQKALYSELASNRKSYFKLRSDIILTTAQEFVLNFQKYKKESGGELSAASDTFTKALELLKLTEQSLDESHDKLHTITTATGKALKVNTDELIQSRKDLDQLPGSSKTESPPQPNIIKKMDSLERSYRTDPNHRTLSQIEDLGRQIYEIEQEQRTASKKENPPQSGIIKKTDKSGPKSKKKPTPISRIIVFFYNLLKEFPSLLKKFLSPLKKQGRNNSSKKQGRNNSSKKQAKNAPSVAHDPQFLRREINCETDSSSLSPKSAKPPASLSHPDTTKPNTQSNTHHQHP